MLSHPLSLTPSNLLRGNSRNLSKIRWCPFLGGCLLGTSKNVRSQKRTPKPKNRTNSTKEVPEQFEGVTGHCPSKQGFWGKSHQKVHPKFGEIFLAKVLWGTFSVPENVRCPIQRFRKGVGGRGWRPTAPKIQQKFSPRIVFSYTKGGMGERVQKKGQNLGYGRDFLAPTPSVRQPLFETSALLGSDKSCTRPRIPLLDRKPFGGCVYGWWSPMRKGRFACDAFPLLARIKLQAIRKCQRTAKGASGKGPCQ